MQLVGRYGVSATGPEQSQFSAFCVCSAEGGARRTQPSSFGSTRSLCCQTYGTLWHHNVEATHRVGDLRSAGHPLDPGTIEGQDHEESRFWSFRGWDVSDIRPPSKPLPV